MDLKEIFSITGEPGLHKLKSSHKNGIFVETLDTKRIKYIANVTNKVVSLDNITVYTKEDTIELKKLLNKMLEQEQVTPPVNTKESPDNLKKYFKVIVPDYDEDRVYISDIKKIIKWYGILKGNKILKKETVKKAAPKKAAPKKIVAKTSAKSKKKVATKKVKK